jgi:Rieske Fe-S protein
MADEDQERVEDYLELERYIEALQTGKIAHPPTHLTPEQVRIYQMAALFRSATPENAEPSFAFSEQLKAQLLAARAGQSVASMEQTDNLQQEGAVAEETTAPTETSSNKGKTKPAHFSRRSLLTGGAIAAASLAIGIGTERVIEQTTVKAGSTNTPPPPQSSQLEITDTIPTTWHFVTTLANLRQGAVRFTSNAIVGYVVRIEDSIVALSAACTHMGCIVQWQDNDRRFHCPCHNALFAESGAYVNTRYRYELPPLPSLNTKIEDGKVYVEVPA